MNKKGTLACVVLFCGLLLSVAVVQFIHEIAAGERIQAFDILGDTFLTPEKRLKTVREDFGKISKGCEHILSFSATGDEEDTRYETAEALLADAENARRHFFELNRHISDSLLPEIGRFDSLVVAAKVLRDAIDQEDEEAIADANNRCKSFADTLLSGVRGGGPFRYCKETMHAFFTATFFNNHYIRGYEKDLEKRSVIASTIRPVMQHVRYRLLGDPGEKAIKGKLGWLFYRPGVEYLYRPSVFDRRSKTTDYNDKPLMDDPVEAITDFRDQLALRNIDLLIVVTPGKASVYPDYFTGPPGQCVQKGVSQTSAFLDTLTRHGINVVDLFSPYLRERCNDSLHDEKMYLSLDTHWKYRGLSLAAATVAARIQEYPWYQDDHFSVSYALDTVTVQREGDIGVMTDLGSNPFERLRIFFPLEATRCVKVLKPVLDEDGAVTKRVPYKDDYKNARILILGDSFSRIYQTDAPGSSGFISHLAADLSEPLASLISDGGASTLVREKLARNSGLLKSKRLVVWEFVERDIRFGAFGWKKVKLQ